MKNSSFAERKQIIRPSEQELSAGYQSAPLRQILSLKISQFEQLILISFFSHNYDKFKLSINGIAESFGLSKNRQRVKQAVDQLEKLGYLTVTSYSYKVNCNKINEDYKHIILSNPDTDSNRVPDTYSSIMNINPVTDSTRVPVTDSTKVPDTNSNRNKRNNNRNEINEMEKIDKGNEIKETPHAANFGLEERIDTSTNMFDSIYSTSTNNSTSTNLSISNELLKKLKDDKKYFQFLQRSFEYYQRKYNDSTVTRELVFTALDKNLNDLEIKYTNSILTVDFVQESINKYLNQ